MLLSGFGQAVHPGVHGLALSDAFADMQGVGAPPSDHERLAALLGTPLTPHQPPRAGPDPPADASTYYSGYAPSENARMCEVPPSPDDRESRVFHDRSRETLLFFPRILFERHRVV